MHYCKIILNPYKKEDTNLYYFEAFIILKELEFGFFSYKSSSFTPKIHYFLINVKNNKNIYINFNGTINYYSFLTESEKNLFPDNIDNLSFIKYKSYALDNKNETDFLLLEIYNSKSDIKLIGILNDFYSINSYTTLEIEKGNKAGVYIEKSQYYYDRNKKYMILSSNKNIQITTIYSPEIIQIHYMF